MSSHALEVAERDRIRELSRYYCAVDNPSQHSTLGDCPQGDDQPATEGQLSRDITLTALAQLGVLRFHCNRSFVSIIDGVNQHIIAEATASISLRNADHHRPNDGLYLGVRSLDLIWGVCPHTVALFTGRDPSRTIDTPNITANRTRYIIRDFTKEANFRDRPYVVGWPHMRFYAEVPLLSPSGHVLGSYCVVDDEPRAEFDEEQAAGLQEIADAIAQHLENIRISHCHRRADTLVRGLVDFVKPDTERPRERPAPPELPVAANVEAIPDDSQLGTLPTSPSTSTGDAPSVFSPLGGSELTATAASSITTSTPPLPVPVAHQRPKAEGNRRVSSGHASTTLNRLGVSIPDANPLSHNIANSFSRASELLRDSLDLDGVVFLDASRCNAGVVLTEDEGTWVPLPTVADPEYLADPHPSPLDIPGVGSLSRASQKECEWLGHAWRPTNSAPADKFTLQEKWLRRLITTYPRGGIINLQDCAKAAESDSDSPDQNGSNITMIYDHLAKTLPEANSLLFLPLWDWSKGRWLTGTLVWTCCRSRVLSEEDLHYFRVFGNSIISEVARFDAITTQKSKSDFISSVSHELRSPLHGILTSAELLQATTLQPHQQQLMKMLESCGLTLLDTLNHLLDFAKINNLTTRAKALEDGTSSSSALDSVFDLDNLIEEVINIQYTGQKHSKASSQTTSIADGKTKHWSTDELTVVLRVDDPGSWKVQSVTGAWRRIVMNLLSNSMKWTSSGFVEVSLSKAKKQSESSIFAHLSVTDTGRGIAPDFLKHNLFSPFAQENSVADGLGLGMSIVRQLIASLGGHINVRSEVGVGTQVDVYIPTSLSMPGPCDVNTISQKLLSVASSSRLQVSLVGIHGFPALHETPTGILSVDAKRKIAIQGCLMPPLSMLSGWEVCWTDSVEHTSGDVAVMEEATYFHSVKQGGVQTPPGSKNGIRCFIILSGRSPNIKDEVPWNVIRVSQPYGPAKLLDAIVHAHELLKTPPTVADTKVDKPSESWNIAIRPVSQSLNAQTPGETSIMKTASTTPTIAKPNDQKSTNVLIVDDNEINLKILATFVRRIGCSHDTATNGLIAVNKYKESACKYDVILMDISMPVMDGLIATSLIRQYEKEKGLSPSRIMGVTGVASADMKQRAVAAGFDDYLIKPISLRALKGAMEKM